jgi:ATP-dependent helicase HrpA
LIYTEFVLSLEPSNSVVLSAVGATNTAESPLSVDSLFKQLNLVMRCDLMRFKKRLHQLKKISDNVKKSASLEQVAKQMQQSISIKQLKLKQKPTIVFPESLPVSQNVARIAKTIADNQVVIIAGETGSGKTTQIPKICLQLGRGIDGIIGHTQPRRIAARTVATRIAQEMDTTLGNEVGYKVRFNDQVKDTSLIKLMTDGILLAEMQHDRLLRKYDTLIIDEAHERSLNIDFILGYLKQILVKRPDLKVIITSATIDPERFAKHFADGKGRAAPIIEVSGRTFPVEMRYRPLNEDSEDNDVTSGILKAISELSAHSLGDILIFLHGEREIRETAKALEKAQLRHTHILPLYSRLTVQEQNKIFQPHSGRNIVLATNVAETSLTVPGIKYVIDPGKARISRYSYRTKVQRLPIEAISQASANQRSGRCGRVSSGICIRLYSEDDFMARPEFTDPEILRTNLATVILQMLSLDLGNIADFPFVQPPDSRFINDGIRLLEELNAIAGGKDKPHLTKVGRLLATFPVDPRLSRMILSAIDLGCIEQVCIIVSGLTIQDVRERPHEKQQAADEQHNRFKNKHSDFISLYNLWLYIKQQQAALTNNQFRKLCKKEFLSFNRVQEWQDIFNQLKLALKDNNIVMSRLDIDLTADDNSTDYDIIHQAILSGLLGQVGQLAEQREFNGPRGSTFYIFPGSGIAKKAPKWIMAAELVETSRLFARTAAKIDPLWIEPMAGHLIKRHYSEPHWEKKQGAVMAFEQVTLYGLVIVSKRKIHFKAIEPLTCRALFIRHALVEGDASIRENFFKHNHDLVKSIEQLEQKARRRDFLIDEQQLVDFYEQKLPEQVICQKSFLGWWKKAKKTDDLQLNFSEAFLLNQEKATVSQLEYPDMWQQGGLTLPLSYHFNPGDIDDGISVHIPIGLLNQIANVGFDWLIPALRTELIIALIKGLPKSLRRNFVPAPNYAQACMASIEPFSQSICAAISQQLLRMTGVKIDEQQWLTVTLPIHLTMNFKVFNEQNKLVAQSRNLEQLTAQLQGKVKASIKKVADKGIERQGITSWDLNALPQAYEKKMANITIKAYPALVDRKTDVAIELFEHQSLADQAMAKGLRRLILLNIPSPLKFLQAKLPNKAKLGLYFNPFGSVTDLLNDCIQASTQYLLEQQGDLPRNEADFNRCKDYVRAELADCVLQSAIQVEQVLSLSHELTKKLKGNMPLPLIQSHGDIKNHLSQLIFKGFITASGVERLADIGRYLKAMQRRIEKLPIDPNQDRLKMLEIEKVDAKFQAALVRVKHDHQGKQQVDKVRWMIEEFRVSIFAQNLKTPYPISAKRIINHLKTLE